MVGLPRGMAVSASVESVPKRLVICEDVEVSPFQEMVDCQVNCKQFSVEVLYLVSAGCNFLEKYESGCHAPSMYCCSTAPTATSDASVIRQVGASALG